MRVLARLKNLCLATLLGMVLGSMIHCSTNQQICLAEFLSFGTTDGSAPPSEAERGETVHEWEAYRQGKDRRGEVESPRKRFKRWLSAAKQNHPPSQYEVALLYERGDGVRINFAEAYYWFRRAELNGVSEARPAMESLAAKMDADTIAYAENKVERWLKKNPPLKASPTPLQE